MEINIIGVTGLVGNEILNLLEKINTEKISKINFIASEKSKGKLLNFKNQQFKIVTLDDIDFYKKNITINCSSSKIANEIFEHNYKNENLLMIDNSSALRMLSSVPLVVPHINFSKSSRFIANPNCSTIILSCLLNPLLEKEFERIIVSTYQAASGAGKEGLDELMLQMKEITTNQDLTCNFWGKQYVGNCFVHNSQLTSSFYNTEETKLINETKKIFNDSNLKITATCIRVPTIRSHCESVNIQFKKPITYQEIINLIKKDENLVLMDDKDKNEFPDTIVSSNDPRVFVGHIRSDNTLPENIGWNFWISGDQILRGAAFNAVEILKKLIY